MLPSTACASSITLSHSNTPGAHCTRSPAFLLRLRLPFHEQRGGTADGGVVQLAHVGLGGTDGGHERPGTQQLAIEQRRG
jgi:hypothetical protein